MNDADSICFLSQGTGNYSRFLITYALFALYHNPGSCVEMIVDSPQSFKKNHNRELQLLQHEFGENSIVVRRKRKYIPVYNGIMKGFVRFQEIPRMKRAYTYIGDSDIFILENILPFHKEMMDRFKLPYSNIQRKNRKRCLTGLHCVRTKDYYTENLCKILKTNFLHFKKDEKALYFVCSRTHGIVPTSDPKYRPSHGFHLSPHRGVGKRMKISCNHHVLSKIENLIKTVDIFKQMYSISPSFKSHIKRMKTECASYKFSI